MSAALPPPVNVSPLIRFGRYSFLTLGICWGLYHQNRLSNRETKLREIEAKQKVARDAQLAIIKKRNAEAEEKELSAMFMPASK